MSIHARSVRAHALKNCLSVVSAVSFLIDKEVSDRGRERLARLRAAVEQMKALLNEDLAPTDRAEKDDTVVDSKPIEVNHLVASVVLQLRDCAERAGVQVVVACEDGWVRGDRSLLAEALHNLISNAIAATRSEGFVRIRTIERPDGGQEWTIADTGCGMAAEVLSNVGRPFFTTRDDGSGVGILVARDALRRHGGDLTFESEVGVGTTVRMFFPRDRCGRDSALR